MVVMVMVMVMAMAMAMAMAMVMEKIGDYCGRKHKVERVESQ